MAGKNFFMQKAIASGGRLCHNGPMERQTTCCFTGHRAEKLPWKNDEHAPGCVRLKTAIEDVLSALYADGCRHFICGMATGADMYFGEAVTALREEHPDVTLEAAIPFEGQEKRWPVFWQRRYARLAEQCDSVTVLRRAYTPSCMIERNHYMVDASSILIAAYNGAPGGTQATIRYALKQGLQVIELPIEDA